MPRNSHRSIPSPGSDEDWQQRLEKAQRLASQGELSHAARLIRSNGVAPGTPETLAQLTDPALRPPHRMQDIPHQAYNYRPDEKVELNKDLFIEIVHIQNI